MVSVYWRRWAKAAGIRAVKTFAQVFCATIGTTTMIGAVDWRMVLSTSILSAVLSLMTSVAGIPEVKDGEE